jgi:hypothetical protein
MDPADIAKSIDDEPSLIQIISDDFASRGYKISSKPQGHMIGFPLLPSDIPKPRDFWSLQSAPTIMVQGSSEYYAIIKIYESALEVHIVIKQLLNTFSHADRIARRLMFNIYNEGEMERVMKIIDEYLEPQI